MTLKNNWVSGEAFTATDANNVANQVNTNATNIALNTANIAASSTLVGDNSTNNTTALAALLNDNTRAELYIPLGVYRYSSIAVTRSAPLKIWGPGTLRSTLGKTTNTTAFQLLGSDITIRDLTFDFTTAIDNTVDTQFRPGGADVIFVGDVGAGSERSRIVIDNVKIYDARTTAIFTKKASDVSITNCVIQRACAAGIMVSDTDGRGNILIHGNHIYDTGDDSIWVGNTTSMTNKLRNVVVTSNFCELADGKGIGFGGVENGGIIGNTVKTTWTPGIMITEDTSFGGKPNANITVADNVVNGGGQNFGTRYVSTSASSIPHGVMVGHNTNANTDIVVENNLVVGTKGRGIQVTNGTRITVRGNCVRTAGSFGVFAGSISAADYDELTNLTIDDNIIENVVIGMEVGSVDGLSIKGNYLRSFDSGDAGTTYGIRYGWVKYATIEANHLVNDDAANNTIAEAGTNTYTTVVANTEITTSDADKNIRSLLNLNGSRLGFGSAAPTTGTWIQGDLIINTAVISFGNIGWICRTGGTPGTWQSWGVSRMTATYDQKTWDPASIASGASTSTTMTITDGAAPGDVVTVGHSGAVPAGCLLTGAVTSTNTVTVTLANLSGSTVDVGSGTLTAILFKPN